DGVRVVARITAELPADSHDLRIHVLVNAPAEAANVTFADACYAGTFQPFGAHGGAMKRHEKNVIQFSIGLTNSIKRLTAEKRLAAGQPLHVSVVANVPGVALKTFNLKVTQISITSN